MVSFRRTNTRSRCLSLIILVAFIAVVLVVTIPLAIILPRRKSLKHLKSTVLVPLYIYPAPGAWNPLYEAVVAHPHLDFLVILNPGSGPGSSQYPSNDYVSQIQRLNTYLNVRTIGYVPTGYASRNITSVLHDVSTYSGWAAYPTTKTNSTGLAVHGIFFDEAPYEYSEEAADYLKTINRAVKNASGLLPDRMIIHNPGTIPDARLADPSTDSTIVFEGPYEDYPAQQAQLASLPDARSRYSYAVHSVAPSISKAELRSFVGGLSQHAKFLFVTELDQNYYESFGREWANFVDVMPK